MSVAVEESEVRKYYLDKIQQIRESRDEEIRVLEEELGRKLGCSLLSVESYKSTIKGIYKDIVDKLKLFSYWRVRGIGKEVKELGLVYGDLVELVGIEVVQESVWLSLYLDSSPCRVVESKVIKADISILSSLVKVRD